MNTCTPLLIITSDGNRMSPKNFLKRSLRICYWDLEAKFLDRHKLALERELRTFSGFTFHQLKSLTDPALNPCDLLIIVGPAIDGEDFLQWMQGLMDRVEGAHQIRIPALIVADPSKPVLVELLESAINSNWYFDIVSPGQLETIPLRMANLLRIHDHLHELHRYDAELKALHSRVIEIEKQLAAVDD